MSRPTASTETTLSQLEEAHVPHEPLGRLFLRFLRFGALAWGGPVAQIAMIRQELVEEENWVSREHFNRVLALYQVLPGPEAHELCVYFGMLSRGRLGGFLAGLGFMLPGFLLMFALSWAYVRFGLGSPKVAAVFGAVQAAVGALIVRAVVRIGGHVLHGRWLWAIAFLAALSELAGVHFAITLLASGFLYVLSRKREGFASILGALCLAGAVLLLFRHGLASPGTAGLASPEGHGQGGPSHLALLWSGLKAGMLTFGGAYTVIPFLQTDAVVRGAWMTNAQFLDGLALSGLLPAPLIIFSTFVGYLGGGPLGALVLTVGIFFPAFAFTLWGHSHLERLLGHPRLRFFLGGVTAGVVGLIGATTLGLLRVSLTGMTTLAIFGLALGALFKWKAKLLIPLVILSAALIGFVLPPA
jgi:chromate transporter